MRIKVKDKERIRILTLSGSLQHGDTDAEFVSVIQKCLAKGQRRFVVDLGKVRYFYSTALGSLLAGYKLVAEAGGSMVLARSTRKIKSVMIQTQLIRLFRNFESVADAIEALRNEPVKSTEPQKMGEKSVLTASLC